MYIREKKAVQIPIVAYGQSINDEALSNEKSFIEPVLEEQITKEAEILYLSKSYNSSD